MDRGCGYGSDALNISPPIVWHDTIDSTNAEAKRLADAGSFSDCWIAARKQSAGRGRLGRNWDSPTGNLFATALICVPGGVAHALRLPFAAALAVHDAVARFAPGAAIALKWPNDVRCRGAKLSGILVESGSNSQIGWAAVGIGINVASAPTGAGQSAACLADLTDGPTPGVDHVLEALVEAFDARKAQAWDNFASTRADWCDRAEGRSGMVKARIGERTIEGHFVGLADDGGLVLDLPGGERETIRAGDVELVRQQ